MQKNVWCFFRLLIKIGIYAGMCVVVLTRLPDYFEEYSNNQMASKRWKKRKIMSSDWCKVFYSLFFVGQNEAKIMNARWKAGSSWDAPFICQISIDKQTLYLF